MVLVGDTEVEPDRATLPIPWSMVIVVASVTIQFKVALSPSVRIKGLPENELIIGLMGVTPPQPTRDVKRVITRKNSRYFILSLMILFILIYLLY
jgi:hypothetical protein